MEEKVRRFSGCAFLDVSRMIGSDAPIGPTRSLLALPDTMLALRPSHNQRLTLFSIREHPARDPQHCFGGFKGVSV